jgi:hypothetical protein
MQRASNNGALVSGIGGAVLRSAVSDHGAETDAAVIVGLSVGLASRQIATKDHRCQLSVQRHRIAYQVILGFPEHRLSGVS